MAVKVDLGMFGRGLVRLGGLDGVRPGVAGRGKVRQGMAVQVWSGWVVPGLAGCGSAGLGGCG